MIKSRIRFGEPYISNSENCTGAKLIKQGHTELVEINSAAGLLLYPYTDQVLTRNDTTFAVENGLDLVDAPWETLTDIKNNLCSNYPNIVVRALPKHLIALNKYYRECNPLYFTSKNRFSTMEALIIALCILEDMEKAKLIASMNNMEYVIEQFKKLY